jgi:hypothetical protein
MFKIKKRRCITIQGFFAHLGMFCHFLLFRMDPHHVESRIQTHMIESKVESGSASNRKAETRSASKLKVASGFSIKVQQIRNTNGSYCFIVLYSKHHHHPIQASRQGNMIGDV